MRLTNITHLFSSVHFGIIAKWVPEVKLVILNLIKLKLKYVMLFATLPKKVQTQSISCTFFIHQRWTCIRAWTYHMPVTCLLGYEAIILGGTDCSSELSAEPLPLYVTHI